jgi:hypothetical protein
MNAMYPPTDFEGRKKKVIIIPKMGGGEELLLNIPPDILRRY